MSMLIGGEFEEDSPMAEINVTPLVDVMLVLLIIFMITAPMLHQGVEVALPRTETAATIQQRVDDPLILTLRTDGLVYIRSQPVHPSKLVESLQRLLADQAEKQVYIKGDRNLLYGEFIHIIDLLHQGGILHIGLVTEKIIKG